VLLVALAAWTLPRLYDARHRTDDYQTLARFVEAYQQPGDAIVFDPDKNFHLFLLDYRGSLPWQSIPFAQPVDAAYANTLFSRWAAQYRGLWLLQESGGHDAGPRHPVHDWLQDHMTPALQLVVGERLLILYQPAGAPARTIDREYQPRFEASAGRPAYDQPLDKVRPGDVLHIAVYGPAQTLTFAGQTFPARTFPGRSGFALPIGAGTPAGRQPITVHLADGRDTQLSSVAVDSHPQAAIGQAPPLARPVGHTFGGQALLTSYDLQPPAPRAGQELSVELQWRALAQFADNYTIFVHLLDSSNRVVAQRDSQPQRGQLPTVLWQLGQTLNDRYVVQIPAGLPAGDYQLEVGMYLQSTGVRLPLSDGTPQDHLLLGPVNIR
jgi:hypothetical protein